MIFLVFLIGIRIGLVNSDGLNPIIAPKAGDSVLAEQPYEISWSAGTPGPVKIELHTSDTSYINITESTENDGSYEWIPSGLFAGKDNFFLAICDLVIQHGCTYTFSGRFGILDKSSSGITKTITSLPSTSMTTGSVPASSLPVPPTTTTTSSNTPSTTGSSTVTSPSAIIGSSSSPTSHSGLSQGGTIGLAVALGVVGTALVALGLFFWYRRRHARSAVSGYPSGSQNVEKWHGTSHNQTNVELAGDAPSRREMGATNDVTHELPVFVSRE